MGSADKIEILSLEESRDNIGSENERHTTIVDLPSLNLLIWVGPQKIAQQSLVWDVGWTDDAADLLHGFEIWRKSSMHAENLLVDDGGDWQTVEAIGESLPQFDVVSALAFVVETVDSVDGGALVVSSEDEEVLWVFDLVGEQKADGLEGLLSTIDVISQEEIVGLWWESSILEKAEQVVVLSVDISADLDWGLELEKDWLGDEDLAGLLAQSANLGLGQIDWLSWSRSSDLQKSLDDVVNVDIHALFLFAFGTFYSVVEVLICI